MAGVPLEVFRISAYYKAPQGLSVVNMVAACPTGKFELTCQSVQITVNVTRCQNRWRSLH